MLRLWISISVGVIAGALYAWRFLRFLRSGVKADEVAGLYQADVDEVGIAIMAGFTTEPLVIGALFGLPMYYFVLPWLGMK